MTAPAIEPECNACGKPLDGGCDHCCLACLDGNACRACDPPATSPGLDASTPERALREVERTERREAHKRLRLAREAAAWWCWLAIRREAVAALLDTDDGIRPEVFPLAHAAGLRAAAAEDESGCSEADVRLHLSTVRAATPRTFLRWDSDDALWADRIERRAHGARLRALRSIARDARAWWLRVEDECHRTRDWFSSISGRHLSECQRAWWAQNAAANARDEAVRP